jgi:hypothetical protein
MNLTNYFNSSRFGLLLKMELRRSIKGILIAFVIIFDILLVGFILDNIFTNYKVYTAHQASYAVFLILGGFIITSLSFNDLSNPLRRHNYLTLPASTFEKFLSMWFLTCVVWIVVYTIAFTLYTVLANSIGNVFFKHVTFLAFAPLAATPITAIKYYLVIQGVFLVGAVNFRGYVFPKTLLTILLIAIVGGLVFYIFMFDIANSNLECTLDKCNPMQEERYRQMWQVIQWMFWWLLAPLCWVLAYFGLKDQEV